MSQVVDPCCIVQDLGEDGKNVNQWHWTERDIMNWVQLRLKELFKDYIVLNKKQILLKINSLQQVKGEAFVTNRKRKLTAFYDLNDIRFSWIGQQFGDDKCIVGEASGLIHIPSLCNDEDDYEVKFSLNQKCVDKVSQRLYRLMINKGELGIRKRIDEFLSEMKSAMLK